MVALGKRRFCWWHEKVEVSDKLKPIEGPLPHGWLLGLRERSQALPAFRHLLARHVLADVARLTDGAVLDLVARKIHTREIRIYEVHKETGGGDADDSTPAGASAPFPLDERSSQAPAALPRTGDNTTFPDDALLAAIAQVLEQAAQDGQPFCEECARARAEAGEK